MALAMVSAGVSRGDIEGDAEFSFPDSVIDFFKGGLGQPPGGFPAELQAKVLKGDAPMTDRPGKGSAAGRPWRLFAPMCRKSLRASMSMTKTFVAI